MKTTLVVEGDGNAHGLYDYGNGGWANRLHISAMAKSEGKFDETILVNDARPGRTILAVIAGLDQRIAAYKREGNVTAILQVGLNEAKRFTDIDPPIVDVDRFTKGLERFSEIMKKEKVPTIFVGTAPVNEQITNTSVNQQRFTLTNEVVSSYDKAVQAVAKEYDHIYVNTAQVFSEYPVTEVLADDGYHPSYLGHMAIHTELHKILFSDQPLGDY